MASLNSTLTNLNSTLTNLTNLTNLSTPSLEPFPIHIWPLAIAFLIGGTGAVFGNLMILIAVIRSPDLYKKNRCHIFVGNLALADTISGIYFIIYGLSSAYASIEGLHAVSISNQLCFYINLPAVFSFDAGSLTVLAIGVDRAVSLYWPLFYKNLTRTYVWLFNLSSWLFGGINVVLGFLTVSSEEIVPACAMPTSIRSWALSFWNYSNILINLLVIGSYAAAYTKLRRLSKVRSSNNEQILRNNRLLTSLIVCATIYIFGWMLTMLVIFTVNIVGASASVIFHCSMYVGVLANINVGCNFYVYWARSDEYRRAFRNLLRCCRGKIEPMMISTRGGGDRALSNRSDRIGEHEEGAEEGGGVSSSDRTRPAVGESTGVGTIALA